MAQSNVMTESSSFHRRSQYQFDVVFYVKPTSLLITGYSVELE